MTDVFILAGEASGDLHASHLLKALKESLPHVHAWGVGGPLLKEQGLEIFLPMKEFQLMGFVEIVKNLRKIRYQFNTLLAEIQKRNPKLVLLVDYPGFNIRLAQRLRKNGYQDKIIQYISPAVWAWGKGRIEKMAKSLDLLLVILPFEPDYFSKTSLPVQYVGHPVIEEVFSQEKKHSNLISIFPGSRKSEIIRNLSYQLDAAALLKKDYPNLTFAVSCAEPAYKELIAKFIADSSLPTATLTEESPHSLMEKSHLALAKSGTVTLELAVRQVPTIMSFWIPWYYRFIASWIITPRIGYYCIVNILAKREVFPEFVTQNFTGRDLYQKAKELLQGPQREACIQGCQDVISTLGKKKASQEAAKQILEALQ